MKSSVEFDQFCVIRVRLVLQSERIEKCFCKILGLNSNAESLLTGLHLIKYEICETGLEIDSIRTG